MQNAAKSHHETAAGRAVRWALTFVALLFLTLFVVVPLALVFVNAFEKGWHGYLAAI